MARQIGPLKISGNVGGLNFYQTSTGFYVRMEGCVDAKRIARDPSFKLTRMYNTEFGKASRAGALFRQAFRGPVKSFKDSGYQLRVMQLMTSLKNADTESMLGKRNVSSALSLPGNLQLVCGFEFHATTYFQSVFSARYVTDPQTGAVCFENLVPTRDFIPPRTATHVLLSAYYVQLDFERDIEDSTDTEVCFTLDNLPRNFALNPDNMPTGAGLSVTALKIQFLRDDGDELVPLKKGGVAMKIVEVEWRGI